METIILASEAHKLAYSNDNVLFQYWVNKIMHDIKEKATLGEIFLDVHIPFKGYDKDPYAISSGLANRIRDSFLDYGYRLSDDRTNGGLYLTIMW